MTAYLIYLCHDVTDRSGLEKYWEVTQATFRGQKSRIHTAYTPLQVLEGDATVHGVVIAEYPSFEACRAWYDSPGYVAGRQHRLRGADYLGLLADGSADGPATDAGAVAPDAGLDVSAGVGKYVLQLLPGEAPSDTEDSLGEAALSVTNRVDILEGDRPVSTVVLARFDSEEPAREWLVGRPAVNGALTLLIDGGWLPPEKRMPHLTARSSALA
ncbi:DUF1330 domain-containing protein [Pseudonocardia sp. NPDC046786]|uniref:DUF1330 domain-containing protein n=1 Tax=Pseudonocardia sp. NPDC046786 TaxID=3155471 RepID=UPI003410D22A